MEFVMIVEPDEVGRKRLEAVFQTEKPSFSYQITGRPEEALDILEHQKTDVLVCETSLSVLSGREFFTMAKMISPDTVRVAMTSVASSIRIAFFFYFMCEKKQYARYVANEFSKHRIERGGKMSC